MAMIRDLRCVGESSCMVVVMIGNIIVMYIEGFEWMHRLRVYYPGCSYGIQDLVGWRGLV